MTAPLRIAVAGASGRMGRMLIEAVNAAPDCTLAGTLDIGCDIASGLASAQVLIDFTRPEGTLAHLAVCRERGIKAVIGTTGFSDAQKAEIAAHAKQVALMLSPNMSVGVNVVLRLLDTAARALAEGYDIEIVEGDTDRIPYGMGTYASRSLSVVGAAIARGADRVIDKASKLAAHVLECGPGDIEQAHKPNEYVSLDQLGQCEAFLRRLMQRVCG